MFNKVLCAYDGSSHAKKALDSAITICKENPNTEFHLIHSVKYEQIPQNPLLELSFSISQAEYLELAKKQGEQTLSEGVEYVKKSGIKVHGVVYQGDPAATILDYADENNVDLIVVGSRGLSGFKELFLGSVSHRISQSAKCSVLIVK